MTRKEAIKIIKNEEECVLTDCFRPSCESCNLVMETDAILTALDMAIKALEREPCGNCVNKNILKAQMEYYGFHAPYMTITEFAEDLFLDCKWKLCKAGTQMSLPECEDVPDTNVGKREQEPCEDAVSRVDVLECFSDLYDTFEDCSKGIVNELHRKFDDLRTLPSVTPKCCPNCGADMSEDNNG